MSDIYAAIQAERQRQDEKWGPQNHPDGTGQFPEVIEAHTAQMACQAADEGGYLDWLHILREEYAEAMAETDPARLRAELVQVAAVAVAWIEAIDRRIPDVPPCAETWQDEVGCYKPGSHSCALIGGHRIHRCVCGSLVVEGGGVVSRGGALVIEEEDWRPGVHE